MAAFSFPSNPTDNQVYEAPNGVTYQYVHSRKTWSTTLSSVAASTTANPGANPPNNPVVGTFWMDTDSNTLYVYVSGEWQRVGSGTGTSTSTSTPALALEGSAVYDGDIVMNDIGIFLETLPET
jgi:hypothetical protein